MALDQDKIALAALELLKEGGLAAVSMRKLAQIFDVKGASLYHHFPSKRALMDLMMEKLLRSTWRPPHEGEDWRDWFCAVALRLRSALLPYPDSALIASGARPTNPDSGLQSLERGIKPCLDVGFSREDAILLRVAAYRFTIGWIMEEQNEIISGRRILLHDPEQAFILAFRALLNGFEPSGAAPA